MKKQIWIPILIVVVIIVGVVIFVPKSKNSTDKEMAETEKEPIKIGALLSLTGTGVNYGEKTRVGIEIALEDIRKDENILQGRKIEIIYEDTQGDPKTAVTAIQKLIDVNKVPVIIGPIFSDEVLAVAPITNSQKVVLLVTGAATDKIKDIGDYVFRNRVSASPLSAYLAQYLYEKLNIKKIAVAYENSANSIDYKNGFIKKFEEMGGKILSMENFNQKEKDFRTQIIKLKQSNPKAVFITGHAEEIGYFLKQSKELNFESNFYSTAGAESDDLIKIAGTSAEGLILCSEAVDIESDDLVIQNFRNKYKTQTNKEPDFFSANGYDALKMIVMAGSRYGFTSSGIKKGLYEIKNFSGVGGLTSFDSDGEVIKPLMIKTIKNGQFVPYEE